MAKKRKVTAEAAGLRWVGDGSETIVGVPPRDLTAVEADRFAALIAAVEENTGRTLYVSPATIEDQPVDGGETSTEEVT